MEYPIKFLCPVLEGPPPGGPFLQGLLCYNPQQFSTLNAQKKICGNKEGRKRRRGRTTNVFFRECGNPLSIPQSTFSISGKYMEFYLMIYHLSGDNFFKDINILGGSTLVRQFTHHYSPEKKFGSQNKRRDIDVWKEKVIQKRSTLGKIVIFAFVLDKHIHSSDWLFNRKLLYIWGT